LLIYVNLIFPQLVAKFPAFLWTRVHKNGLFRWWSVIKSKGKEAVSEIT
jgi:hypothetical protein